MIDRFQHSARKQQQHFIKYERIGIFTDLHSPVISEKPVFSYILCSVKLNAFSRFSSFTNLSSKKTLIEAFVYSQFNYCPLVWHFYSSPVNKKIESIQKRALIFLYNDFSSNYENLLEKAKKPTMEVKHLRILALEVHKALNNLIPTFIKDFSVKQNSGTRQQNN